MWLIYFFDYVILLFVMFYTDVQIIFRIETYFAYYGNKIFKILFITDLSHFCFIPYKTKYNTYHSYKRIEHVNKINKCYFNKKRILYINNLPIYICHCFLITNQNFISCSELFKSKVATSPFSYKLT